jgi:hypothetical protein
MRIRWSILTTLLALAVAAPAAAQVVTIAGPNARPELHATPEAMVARLMSFDANHDGRVAPSELPERMQPFFSRADTSRDGALDADEVLRLAQRPPVVVAAGGLQAGHYGFGEDFGLDTRLHIEGAIEDLRLAADRRNEALSIGHRFIDAVNAQAKADVLSAAEPLLTAEQFADFKVIVDQPNRPVAFTDSEARLRADLSGLALTQQQTTDPEATLRTLMERVSLISRRGNLTAVIQKYFLPADEQQKLQAAVQRFQTHDRLSETERTALLNELRGVLNEQERDDLRAALERRPIIKQEGVTATVIKRATAVGNDQVVIKAAF